MTPIEIEALAEALTEHVRRGVDPAVVPSPADAREVIQVVVYNLRTDLQGLGVDLN